MPTMCDNSLRMKLSVILQTGSSFHLTEEVAVAIVDLGRTRIALRISLFRIWNDENIRTIT